MDFLVLGPLGQRQGNRWEETGRNVISHIFVYFDERSVVSISFGFIEKGALVLSRAYGFADTVICSVRIVRLNHESEFVTGLSGEWTGDFITCLNFHTNEKTHEAFRSNFIFEEEDKIDRREFHSGIHDRSEFGGFFGSCSDDDRLLSIGFYIQPILQGVNLTHREVWPL
ncbi:Jacalin-related lectin 24 [Cardamine amara subsp. amara]|uniref:Jacalin-related lectin 24 n=1 Tax=Cardamine amara subsp. amara TaxID=228776 RepID=A0ABD0Z948_CARAN